MEQTQSLAAFHAALAAWKAAHEELARLDGLARAAVGPRATINAAGNLKSKMAKARTERERHYRAALSAMQAHHDRNAGAHATR